MFDNMTQARAAALDLEKAGILHSDISLVANNETEEYAARNTDTGYAPVEGHAIGHDATVGAEIGGVAGLILGLTGVMIPGLGWIAGAGWLMGTILGAGTGAIIGGLVGALTHVGVPTEDAGYYTEGVRRGGTLVAVRAEDIDAQRVADILSADGAVDINERAAQYRAEGYSSTSTGYPPISDTGYIPPTTVTPNTDMGTTTMIAPPNTTNAVMTPPITDTTLPVVAEPVPPATPLWNAGNDLAQDRAATDLRESIEATQRFTPDEVMSTEAHRRGEELEDESIRQPAVINNPTTAEKATTTPDRTW
jgi:hypothetical protein